ncbi:hypothetical protein BC940DRAFT_371651 [Gongronella butleri]|nr:hypothetical protein BC940DRAFT_371651 [Gongronella butleri]
MAAFYSERPEWADVTPIPQDDGPNPLVPIAYSADYTDAMDYFRAVSKANEKSERVLGLLADIIEMNPAHYTVWQYRQQVLFALHSDLKAELDYLDMIAENQVKNYQVWHHRQVIVDALNDCSREMPFINAILDDDSKNYHAWSYRQWVIRRFNLWDAEWQYTNDMITLDIRNNSAWNHRYFLLFSRPESAPDAATINQEIDYTKSKIALAPNNSCGWAYLHALLDKQQLALNTLTAFLKELLDKQVAAPQLYSTWIDLYVQDAKSSNEPINAQALEYCDLLAEHVDPIRKKYWQNKKAAVSKLL